MPKLSQNFLHGRVHFYIDAAAADMRTARNPPVKGDDAKASARAYLIERSRRALSMAREYRAMLAVAAA